MLATKLHISTTNVNLVHRSDLYELLNKGLNRKLVLISAPAGFGKTTLISDWIKHKKILTDWYSIDRRDNDPAEFLNYIISGIQNIKSDFGLGAQQLLVVRQSLFSLYNESVVKGN